MPSSSNGTCYQTEIPDKYIYERIYPKPPFSSQQFWISLIADMIETIVNGKKLKGEAASRFLMWFSEERTLRDSSE